MIDSTTRTTNQATWAAMGFRNKHLEQQQSERIYDDDPSSERHRQTQSADDECAKVD